MRRIIISQILFLLIIVSCTGQNQKTKEEDSNINQPKTSVKVNREYDENGKLIRYDSTYSYYYSNIENDAELEDSVIDQFRKYFNKEFIFSEDPFFNDLFFHDTLLDFNFYTKDYFLNRFRNNTKRMDELFWEMDSMKNLFFKKQFPVISE